MSLVFPPVESFSVTSSLTARLVVSFSLPFSVSIFAFDAFPSIPLSPVSVTIATPASIKSTIIVITRAISVIPLSCFEFNFFFMFFPLPFL